MANPALRNLPAFSEDSLSTTSTSDVMTFEDTIRKTFIAFTFLLVGAVVGWMIPMLMIPAALIGFVLALVNIFKKAPSRALVLAYAGAEGVFIGGISRYFEAQWDGIVTQTVFGTLGVVGVTLLLFLNKKVRTSPKMNKIFLIAMVGYLAFSLVNLGLMMFGITDSQFGLRDTQIFGIPLGVILGILVVFMAAYSLVGDFESVEHGVRNGAPRVYGWKAAFGVVMTVVWLYIEILRMIAIIRSN